MLSNKIFDNLEPVFTESLNNLRVGGIELEGKYRNVNRKEDLE